MFVCSLAGQWLCRPCGDGEKPVCVLCPNLGGAMKCTPSGHKWAHVSCVLWIPEVSIGCAEKMEPITKISAIPSSRWSLICVLCRERTGACIQCSVRTCKTAYHVTCAFKHGLEMRAIIEDENADDGVKLRSYCQKHSVNCKKEKAGSGSEEDDSKRKRRKDMTSEEKSQARAQRLSEIEEEFDKHVSVKDISTHLLDVDQDGIQYIYNYWKLKRRSGHNRPLLPPKADETDMLTHRQEQADLDKMKMFVQLRQDLERVRNLCYMVSRREKLSRSFFRMREQTFHKQVGVLSEDNAMTPAAMTAVIEANHGPSIYDRLYSHPDAVDHSGDFDNLLAQIAGVDSGDEKKKDLNGLTKSTKSAENPYKRLYLNGSARRSASLYSGLSSGAESIPDRDGKYRSRPIYSTTDDEDTNALQAPKKKMFSKDKENNENTKLLEKKKAKPAASNSKIESSSEDEIKAKKREWPKSRTLRQMEREMSDRPLSGTESDELMPMRSTKKLKLTPADIYSDSENSDNKHEDDKEDKSSNATSDSQQHPFRTKAAVKEFIPSQKGDGKGSKSAKKSGAKDKGPESDEDLKDKENMKSSKNKDYPSDLIVPQRQAAKKASENMRSNTVNVKTRDQNEASSEAKPIQPPVEEVKQPKPKAKLKDKKDKESVKDKKDRKSSLSGNDIFEFEKEERDTLDIIAYVPQRQAAKKAAEHIKSGMTKPPGTENPPEEVGKKKETEVAAKKPSPKKEEEKRHRSPNKSSSGSTNNTSSSSSSSSSSSEDEDEVVKLEPKGTADKSSVVKSFSPHRRMNELPFLDKGQSVISSSSPSSDSETPKDSSQIPNSASGKSPDKKSPKQVESVSKPSSGVPRKAPDKKLKTSDGQPEHGLHSPTAEREKSARSSLPLPRPSVRARTRSVTAGTRNLPAVGKPRKDSKPQEPKEDSESSELSFTQWEKDKKLKSTEDSPAKDSQSKRDKDIMKKSKSPKYSDDTISMTPKVKDKDNRKSRKSQSPYQASPTAHKTPEYVEQTLRSPENSHKQSHSVIEHTKVKDEILESVKPLIPEIIISEQIDEKESSIVNEAQSYTKTPRSVSIHVIKSPKTPLRVEHNMAEPCEGKTPKSSSETGSNNLKIPPLESTEKPSTFEMVPPEFNELQEAEQNKLYIKTPILPPPYLTRSIFSPQPTGKDTGCSEFFDFSHDILAVDETLNDDGFNISQGNEVLKATPLTFFGSDFLFKEDSKEDRGVRETFNLVEKLRLQMSSKKSNSCVQNEHSDQDMSDIKESDIPLSLSFIENEAYPKSHPLDESKSSIDATITNSISKHDPDLDSVMQPIAAIDSTETNYDESSTQADLTSVENLDKCKDLPESEKAWSSNDNHFTDSSNTNIDIDKQMHFHDHGVQHRDSLHNAPAIHENSVTQGESLDGSREVKPFLQMQEEKSYESNMETDSNVALDPLHISTSQSSETNISSLQQESQRPHYERDIGSMMMQPECTPIPSPYNSMRRQSKWAESELIPVRRSSTSSSNSDSSVSLNKHDNEHSNMEERDIHKHSEILQNMGYSYLACGMESHPYNPFSSEASQFVGPVSLFPPTTIGSQLPLSSPGAALFPPSLPYSNSSSLLSLPKSSEESIPFSTPCTAAFTSSSHNMALTTAMIAPPTPKPVSEHSSTHDGESELTPPNSFSMQESPLRSNEDLSNSTLLHGQLLNDKHLTDNDSPVQGKKSPIKPTRMSSRFISQIKSPGKSPTKSPRQHDAVIKVGGNRRGASKGSRGSRTRGRPRGKGSQHTHNYDIDYHTIHNKLAGTVYDLNNFDEDITNDSINDLKSMRERRRSTDIHERKPDNAYRDSSQSPKFASPSQQQALKRPSYSADIRDMRPPAPIPELPDPVESSKSPITNTSSAPAGTPQQGFAKIVQPVLPGPVDMRTYSGFDATITDAFNNLLGAFASGTADQQLPDIDEEMEKELHSALIASSNKSQEPLILSPKLYNDPRGMSSESSSQQGQDLTTPKVSLSDSRNQLKVKIKGPFLDANYPTSSVAPVIQQPTIPILEPPSGIPILGAPSAVGSVTSAMISGTSNLRRMRKKELLRQYCTQDMNMDDPMIGTVINQITPPAPISMFNRTVITIPKAVASMTTIPTREDYKAVVDANMEKKRRKVSGSLIRDIRSSDNEVDVQDIRNAGGLSIPTQMAISYKRRGRISKPSPTIITSPNNISPAPKLKIKIGTFLSGDQSIHLNDPHYVSQIKPPKKRLAIIAKPSVEDLRRESMKYRKKMFNEFEEGKKDKKKRLKSEKSEKRKKKRDKRSEMHIVKVKKESEENNTKLIIRIARKKEPGGLTGIRTEIKEEDISSQSGGDSVAAPAVSADPFDYDPTAPDPLALDSPAGSSKVSPIRLKLARGAGGSGYIMKDSPSQQTPVDSPKIEPLSASLSNNNKHCEVR